MKNIQFVSPRIRCLEGKMNDERMISQTSTVHKLDEVSSWCLADCSKYERELVKKSECGLSCWLVFPAAWKRRERMCALTCWLACPAASQWWGWGREEEKRTGLSYSKGLRGKGWKNVTSPFYSCPGSDPGRMAWNILIGRKISLWVQNSQNISAPDNNLKFFLQQGNTRKGYIEYCS